MAGGCEIQCMVAIDFSGGNPPTNNPASCHFAGKRTSPPSLWAHANMTVTVLCRSLLALHAAPESEAACKIPCDMQTFSTCVLCKRWN